MLPGRPLLLAVATVPPWPARDGYSLRVSHLLDVLRARWAITLISPPIPNGLRPAEIEHHAIELSGPGTTYPWRFDPTALHECVAACIKSTRPHRLLLWPGAETLPGAIRGDLPAVADLIDCNAMEFWIEARAARGVLNRLRALREFAFAARDGARVGRELDAVTLVSDVDAAWQRTFRGRARVMTVPNGVESPLEVADEGSTPTLVFTGTLDYRPNVDAALWAATTIWPLVRAGFRDSGPLPRFIIAGRRPTPELAAFDGRDGIEVHADVPDLQSILGGGWVSVAPMRVGVGLKNKVLESWACGRPAVLTPHAVNGLTLPPGHEHLVASAAPKLGALICKLFAEPDLRHALGAAARAHVSRLYTWAIAGERIDKLLREIA